MHPAVPTYIPFVSAMLTVSLAGRLQVYSKVVFKPATHTAQHSSLHNFTCETRRQTESLQAMKQS